MNFDYNTMMAPHQSLIYSMYMWKYLKKNLKMDECG